MQGKILYLLFSSVIFFTAGCGGEKGTSSQGLDTNQLFVSYRVVSSGNNQAEVSAAFSYSHAVYWGELPDSRTVRLEGDDQLTVEVDGVTHSFNKEEIDSQIVYTSLVNVGDEEVDFKIRFDRPSRSEHYVTDVILPASMEITAPVENQIYSVNDSISLTWTPIVQDQEARICVFTTCFQNMTNTIGFCDSQMPESGEYITSISGISDSGLYSLINESSCTADLNVSRSRPGTVAPEYSFSSYIYASRERTRRITINLN